MQTARRATITSVLVVLAIAFQVSSAENPKTGTVFGVVTFKGKPLPAGTVTFHFAGMAGKKAGKAEIKPDGSFLLKDLSAGEYTVTISTEKAGKKKVPIPLKYSNPGTSGLKVEVVAGRQMHKLNLN
jgi:hypothetical protein